MAGKIAVSLFYYYLMGMKRDCFVLLLLLMNACRPPDRIVDYGFSYHKDLIDTAFLFPASYRQPERDSLEYHELSKLLQVFHEKPLHAYADSSPVIRFYYSGWFRLPVIVRIDNQRVVVKKQNFPQPAFEDRYDSVTKKVRPNLVYQRITFSNHPDSFAALLHYIDTSSFWKTSGITPSGGAADGEEWNVEIIYNGKYNHVQEWSPTNGSLYNLCLQILRYAKQEEELPH